MEGVARGHMTGEGAADCWCNPILELYGSTLLVRHIDWFDFSDAVVEG